MISGGKYAGLPLNEIHHAMRQEFGEITMIPAMFGRASMVVVFTPQDFEMVCRNEGAHPWRRNLEALDYYRKTVRPDIYAECGSLSIENGPKWREARSLVNPILMKPESIRFYVPQVDQIADEFVTMLKKVRDDKGEAAFTGLVERWSLEGITCITLNRKFGLLNDDINSQADRVLKLIKPFFKSTFEIETNPPIWRYYHTKSFKDALRIYDEMTEAILSIIEETIDQLESQPTRDAKEQSVLEKLLKIDKKLAVVTCVDSLAGGVGTISCALLTTLYCLAKNPDKQEKLRAEVMEILPDKTTQLTVSKMKNLPYLRGVLKEGLRMYSPTAATSRKLDKDVVLSGYQVPKGQEVMMAFFMAMNQEENFKKPLNFIPERWLKSNTDPQCPHAKDSHPFSYMPFGFGARTCAGRRFADLLLESLLIRIIRNFKVEWHHSDMKIKGTLVNFPDSEMKFKLIDI